MTARKRSRQGDKAAKPSKAERELGLLKVAAYGSMLSGIASVFGVGFAIIALLSGDMLLEYVKAANANAALQSQNEQLLGHQLKLVNDRVSLTGENAALREARLTLSGQKEKIESELAGAQAEQRRLLTSAAEMRRNLARQTVQVARQRAALSQLAVARDQLKAESASLSDSLREAADTLLGSAMKAHLAGADPGLLNLEDSAAYTFLRADDGDWGVGRMSALVFSALPESEFDESELAETCIVQPGIRVFGLVADISLVEGSVTTVPSDNKILKRICAWLGLRLKLLSTPGRRASSITVYRALQRSRSEAVFVNLLPGQIDGLTYEEWKARAFWAGALGDLRKGKFVRMLDRENSGALRSLYQSGAANEFPPVVRWQQSLAEALADLNRESLRPLRDRFVSMNDAWRKFLEPRVVEVGFRPERLMQGDEFRQFLPRFRFAEIGSPRWYDARAQVRELDHEMLCAAYEFAAAEEYLGIVDDRASICAARRKMIEIIRADMAGGKRP